MVCLKNYLKLMFLSGLILGSALSAENDKTSVSGDSKRSRRSGHSKRSGDSRRSRRREEHIIKSSKDLSPRTEELTKKIARLQKELDRVTKELATIKRQKAPSLRVVEVSRLHNPKCPVHGNRPWWKLW